ncbi:19846_t:CDS:2 [Rhizophagus irregularis]|nr:19846_t:CDS:2 [Rhizophagus irregularis]
MEIFGVRLGKINDNNRDKEDKKLLLGYIDKVGVIEKYLESLRVGQHEPFLVQIYDNEDKPLSENSKEEVYSIYSCYQENSNNNEFKKAIYEFIGEVVIESKNTIWKERCEEVNKWERENILKMIKKEIYYGFNRERWRQAEFYKF